MRNYIVSRIIERFFQFLFMWILWVGLILGLIGIALIFNWVGLQKLLSNILWYSLPLLSFVFIPLIVGIVSLLYTKKGKHYITATNQILDYHRPINILCQTAILIGSKFNLDACANNEGTSHQEQNNCQYQPTFTHIFAPFGNMITHSISRIKRWFNQMQIKPKIGYRYCGSGEQSVD